MKRLHRLLAASTAAALTLTMAACASSNRDSTTSNAATSGGGTAEAANPSSSGGGTPVPDATFVFGAEGLPSQFDSFYATDGATFKVTRQIFEGLVQYKPGTADIAPSLAESWEPSADGLTWTFKIRSGVKFQDGTDLDAAAVCYNFERMYTQTGAGQTKAEYWSDNFGGFKDEKNEDGTPKDSLYKSCVASDPSTAVFTLSRVTSKFPSILGLTSFSIQSPTAMKQYDANGIVAEGESYKYPEYGTLHPTGTGPFKFVKSDTANLTVELARNDDYWGDKAKIKTLLFKGIAEEAARKQELQAGTIDGYDLPNPGDWAALKDAGFNVLIRPAFNVLYLGLDPKRNPLLLDLRVRQAIAYALNRQEFVTSQLAEGAEVALEFYPKAVEGWTDTVPKYDYDPEKAKALLAEAGATNLTLDFWWPSEVTRPYMPNPQAVFQAFSADLAAVGITVNEVVKPWLGGYLDGVQTQEADMYMLGWTGDYNSADNFLGSFFSNPNGEFGTQYYPWGTTLSAELQAADSEPDATKRAALYTALNVKLMGEYLPAIPISHTPPALVVKSNVQGVIPSPLTDERYVSVYITS